MGYLSMALLVFTLGMFIKVELKAYLSLDNSTENDKILLSTNELLTGINEGEHLSKLALNERSKLRFIAYAAKVDTTIAQIDLLKPMVATRAQGKMFDSVQILLNKKVENVRLLRRLQIQIEKNTSIDTLQEKFNRVELSLGRIIPEKLVPDFDSLSTKTQNTIREYTSLLNQNIPNDGNVQTANKKMDSAIVALREILRQAKETQLESRHVLLQRELKIAKTGLELSQKLQQLVSTIEQGIYKDTRVLNERRQAVLKRSAKWIGLLALTSLCVVILFTFLISRDFWKVQRYRKQLEQEKQYSESLLKSREQLIATVSHDLRTPLNTIMGYTELCKQGATHLLQKQHLARISTASGYIISLVNDLLDSSKLEAGQIKINKKSFLLPELIELTATENQKKYANKPINLFIEVHPDLSHPIFADPLRIKQVLDNLISNAFKFTEKGFVKIHAIPCFKNGKKPFLKIEVSDSGIGINKKEHERIFEEFVQSGDETEKKYTGYGLGLAISRRIARHLNGTLHIESEEGLGSRFSLMLPLEFAKEKSFSSQQPITPLKETTLLVFEDDPNHLELLNAFCRRLGLRVIGLPHFKALGPDSTLNYDVVLTDIQMPGNNGFQVLQMLQAGNYSHYTEQPIIAMTGRRDISKKVYLKAGFSSVLRKPFTLGELAHAIENVAVPSLPIRPKITPDTKPKKTGDTSTFDLSYFSAFLGNEKKEITEILMPFLKESRINIRRIKEYMASGAIEKISFTAHRMLPMFYHLRATPITTILKELEYLDQKTKREDIQKRLETLEQEFGHMEKELMEVLTKHPYCID